MMLSGRDAQPHRGERCPGNEEGGSKLGKDPEREVLREREVQKEKQS